MIKSLQRNAMFPEIGQIRKGDAKPSERQPGKDLSYFRFTSDDAETSETFNRVFGLEPRAVEVFLPFASMEDNFEAWAEAYTAGAIQHRCDGETCVGWRTPQGTWSTEPKPCPGGCKAVGRLKVIIPAFRRMAFVTVLTTSKHDIINLGSSLIALQAVKGSLQGIPLVLRRVEREISTPAEGGKRARRKKWLLQIEASPEWASLQFGAMREAALLSASREPLMLTSNLEDDDADDGPTPNTEAENVAAVCEAIKKAAKDCELDKVKGALSAELKKECDIELKGPSLPIALESLTKEKRAAALAHLQKKALDIAEAKAVAATVQVMPQEVHEGEVV
jgi:hypothetical protein